MYQLDVWDFLEKPIAADGQMFLAAAMRVLRDTQNSQSKQSSQQQQEQAAEDLVVDPDTGKAR
ncbi:hypothetical protein, partial [Metapseudomonas otitidis]